MGRLVVKHWFALKEDQMVELMSRRGHVVEVIDVLHAGPNRGTIIDFESNEDCFAYVLQYGSKLRYDRVCEEIGTICEL